MYKKKLKKRFRNLKEKKFLIKNQKGTFLLTAKVAPKGQLLLSIKKEIPSCVIIMSSCLIPGYHWVKPIGSCQLIGNC